MSEQFNNGAAQFRADMPEGIEQESVRTTIVGGRPPGSGQPIGQIPRGLEVLLKKASIDAEFRELLLQDRLQAAESIELTLEPVESAMLQNMPKEQLATIINQTEVPEPHRRAFLGTVAATMLAVLTGTSTALGQIRRQPSRRQPVPQEVGPEPPAQIVRNYPEEIRLLVAETMEIDLSKVDGDTRIALNDERITEFRKEIYRRFDVRMPLKTLKSLETNKPLTDYVIESRKGYEDIEARREAERRRQQRTEQIMRAYVTLGNSPDMPPGTVLWATAGIRSDIPGWGIRDNPEKAPEEVRKLVTETMEVGLAKVEGNTHIVLNGEKMTGFRKEIYSRFDVRMPSETLKSLETVQQLTEYITESLAGYDGEKSVPINATVPPPPIPSNNTTVPPSQDRQMISRGIRPF